MKKLAVVLAASASALLALALVGCLEEGTGSGNYKGPLFRFQFVGRAGLGRDGTAMVLKQIDAMKETAALRDEIARKLSAAAPELWKGDLPADVAPEPELLRPLVEDLTSSEAVVEIRGPIGRTETLIAVELSDERARLWDTNLVQLTRAWKLGAPTPVTVEGVKGWAARRAQAPSNLEVFRAGKWMVIGLGADRQPQLTAALQSAVRVGRPFPAFDGILDVQADLPGLRKWIPVLAQFPLPPAHLTMTGKGANVRTEVSVHYASPIPWKLEPWHIPTNLITEPVTSLTVARGVRPFLERFKGLGASGLTMPNQFCAWGMFHQYGHTFFAVPQPDASNAVFRLASRAAAVMTNYFETPLGQFLYSTNRGELAWGGALPGISPTLAPAREGGNEFIFGRLFPLVGKRESPPPELYAQIQGRANLAYYDWELSSNRVTIARQLYQLANIFDRRPPGSTGTASQKWLEAVAPKLGNTVTEITMTGPQDLLLTRKSQLGLTGFEMATLALWLDSAAFPYRIERPKMIHLNRPGAQPAKAPDGGSRK